MSTGLTSSANGRDRFNLSAEGDATLGDLCRLLGLSPRAIRFYEERGLVSPRRDRLNRRIFDRQQRGRLRVIALLRGAGLSLKETRTVVSAPPVQARSLALRFLSDRIARCRRELEAAEEAFDRADRTEWI